MADNETPTTIPIGRTCRPSTRLEETVLDRVAAPRHASGGDTVPQQRGGG
jgi:hypothetical protein